MWLCAVEAKYGNCTIPFHFVCFFFFVYVLIIFIFPPKCSSFVSESNCASTWDPIEPNVVTNYNFTIVRWVNGWHGYSMAQAQSSLPNNWYESQWMFMEENSTANTAEYDDESGVANVKQLANGKCEYLVWMLDYGTVWHVVVVSSVGIRRRVHADRCYDSNSHDIFGSEFLFNSVCNKMDDSPFVPFMTRFHFYFVH